MKINLDPIPLSSKPVLRQRLELYLYDFSQYDLADVNEHGHYGYDYLDHYWTEPGRHPYFIKIDDQLAGFVLINSYSVVLEMGTAKSVGEFFVMRKYRGKGVGTAAALETFAKFPGRWEVRQFGANEPSKIFWEKVIGTYTHGHFKKQTIPSEDGEEQVITFDNSH